MRALEVDARRYAWCRGSALWIVGIAVPIYLEDVRGAVQAEQGALLRWAARMLGEACAVALNVALNMDRPIPSPTVRGSWALERIQGHRLWQPCWELIQGVDVVPPEVIAERCEELVEDVRIVVGEMPNPLLPEGQLPALALGRDWLKLMDAIGEEPPLPRDWIRPT